MIRYQRWTDHEPEAKDEREDASLDGLELVDRSVEPVRKCPPSREPHPGVMVVVMRMMSVVIPSSVHACISVNSRGLEMSIEPASQQEGRVDGGAEQQQSSPRWPSPRRGSQR